MSDELPHGSLAESLGRSIVGAIQAAVSSTTAFCLISGGEIVKRAAGWLAIHGIVEPACDHHLAKLLPELLFEGAREAHLELVEGHDRTILVSFAVRSMHVCAGVARGPAAPPFEPADLRRLQGVVPVVSQLVTLHAQCSEHERRELVLHALRAVTDAYCVIDLDTRRVRWVHDLRDDQACARDILGDERRFIELVERAHLESGLDEQLVGLATVGHTTVVRTAELGRPAEFDEARTVAVALVYSGGRSPTLSARERQIAQLLARGYSIVNAAAILSLSENTVRTYVRRVYRKLEITNRADLTRKCNELLLF